MRRDTQKSDNFGKGGRSIKEIGAQARQDGRDFRPSCAFVLFVKVRENWIDDPERMRMMGINASS